MTAYAITAAKPKLTLVTLIVLAAHALLLVGLQRWIHSVPVTGVAPVFLIRAIAPEPQAAPTKPAATAPAPLPSKPKPKPHPAPLPAPALSSDESSASAEQLRERSLSAAPEPFSTVRLPRPAQIAYQAVVTQNARMTALPSTIDWQHDGQSYELRWTLPSPALGDRGRHAAGQVTAHGLAPAATDTSSPPGAQDPFSAWPQLAVLIAGNPEQYLVGSRIMDFTVVDDSDIAGAGEFEGQPLPALHLVHEPASDQDARIELWLGKLFDYLPIGLLVVQPGGDRVEMMMRGIHGRQATD